MLVYWEVKTDIVSSRRAARLSTTTQRELGETSHV